MGVVWVAGGPTSLGVPGISFELDQDTRVSMEVMVTS